MRVRGQFWFWYQVIRHDLDEIKKDVLEGAYDDPSPNAGAQQDNYNNNAVDVNETEYCLVGNVVGEDDWLIKRPNLM